jgi:long-chain acyl-CoA synthetase
MTGDTGYIDEDNYLYISGRKKELYKLDNGKYINPSYIEMVLLGIPKIKQIYVYGDNRPFNIALIVPNESYKLEDIEKDIPLYSFDKLKKYEIPHKIIIVEPFTVENKLLTPKMSMIRNNIYMYYKKEINELYK